MRLATGNIRNCAMHAAAMEFVPELEAKLSPPVQREGMLNQSRNILVSSGSNHQHHKTRRVLISPEGSNRLRSLWLTGDNNHLENRKQGLTPTMLLSPNLIVIFDVFTCRHLQLAAKDKIQLVG